MINNGKHILIAGCATLFISIGDNTQANDDERRGSYHRNLPHAVTDGDYHNNGLQDHKKVELGKLLFFDKVLSGNRNISCATCHHPLLNTGDGLSLSVGEGGIGLSVTRNTGLEEDAIKERVPRNTPMLFNLGAKEYTTMFHDGRLSVDTTEPSGFKSPAGDNLPNGLENLLAAQAMFPVTSAVEMAGEAHENNDIGVPASEQNLLGVWDGLVRRLREIPEYVELFAEVFEEVTQPDDITYVHAANAIAAFEAAAWRSDKSPFDRYLRGERTAMSWNAKRGMRLFYGKAGCSSCHSGKFQTDHKFHAIAMPQIGPGKGDNQDGYSDGHDDFGRERVTGKNIDRFRFRTPSLRNVALTAPYGHAGTYSSLRAVIEHHQNPIRSLKDYWETYGTSQTALPSTGDADLENDFIVVKDPYRLDAIAYANELPASKLRKREIDQIMAFLHALTDPEMQDLRNNIPSEVPSGLPVFD